MAASDDDVFGDAPIIPPNAPTPSVPTNESGPFDANVPILPPTPPAPPVTWGDAASAFGRGLGLGTRDVMTGLGLGPFANVIGLPQPQTPREIVQSGFQTGAAGALPFTAIGTAARLGSAALSPLAARTAEVLAAQPVRQAVVGATAGGVQGHLAAAGAPGWLQSAAGYGTALLSGAVPGAGLGGEGDALANLARTKYNLPIFPGQAGSPLTRYIFSTTSKFPTSGAKEPLNDQLLAWNDRVGQTFGAQSDQGVLTPDVMTKARSDLSQAWGNIGKNVSIDFAKDPLNSDLADIETQLKSQNVGDRQVVQDAIDGVREQAKLNNGTIGGGWLQNALNAKGTIAAGAGGSSVVKPQWQALQEALQNAIERNASPADQAALDAAKEGWKNMKTVEPLVAQGGGIISPGSLANRVASSKFQRAAYTGGGDLGELAQIGKRYIKGPPESGSAERMIGEGITAGAPAIAAERFIAGEPKQAAAALIAGAVPYGTAAVVNPLLRMGALAPPPIGGYYARVLANPTYASPWINTQ